MARLVECPCRCWSSRNAGCHTTCVPFPQHFMCFRLLRFQARHRRVKSSEFYYLKIYGRALHPHIILHMLLLAIRLYKGREHIHKISTNKREHEHRHLYTRRRTRRTQGGCKDLMGNSDDFTSRCLGRCDEVFLHLKAYNVGIPLAPPVRFVFVCARFCSFLVSC